MENTPKTYTLKITIDKSEILNEIYAASAWHCVAHPEARCLTPDFERLVMKAVGEGFTDFRSRFLGYLSFSNFNPNIAQQNVQLHLLFFHPTTDELAEEVKEAVVQTLANYALRAFYGEQNDVYDSAWRLHRAQLMLIFGRDAN